VPVLRAWSACCGRIYGGSPSLVQDDLPGGFSQGLQSGRLLQQAAGDGQGVAGLMQDEPGATPDQQTRFLGILDHGSEQDRHPGYGRLHGIVYPGGEAAADVGKMARPVDLRQRSDRIGEDDPRWI